MRNTIIFNLDAACNCNCLAAVGDGSNSLTIKAEKDNFTNPAINITLADGSSVTKKITAADGWITYTIPQSYYNLAGTIGLKITDGNYESDLITIKCTVIESGYNLAVKLISDTFYELTTTKKTSGSGGVDESVLENYAPKEHTHEWKDITDFKTDKTLTMKNGTLSVNTADAVEEDNTLPVTSAAVATQVGNIEVLLSTI